MVKGFLSNVWRFLPKSGRRLIVRLVEPHFTVVTGVVVTDSEGRVLLLDHVFRSGNGWGIPGGFLGTREQPEEAARRELREETGIELDELELAYVHALEFTNQVEIMFRARARGTPRVRGLEVRAFGWFDLNDLPDGLSAEQRRILARALVTRGK
jgi:ADP-ribose pyrophosphatase YjhB (NUDIX family)